MRAWAEQRGSVFFQFGINVRDKGPVGQWMLNTLRIGIMGCIVNGPGEMADADYGYVGAGIGKVSLYKSKTCIEKNIPEADAVQRLIDFIEKDLDK